MGKDNKNKFKEFMQKNKSRIVAGALIVSIGLTSIGLGHAQANKSKTNNPNLDNSVSDVVNDNGKSEVVATTQTNLLKSDFEEKTDKIVDSASKNLNNNEDMTPVISVKEAFESAIANADKRVDSMSNLSPEEVQEVKAMFDDAKKQILESSHLTLLEKEVLLNKLNDVSSKLNEKIDNQNKTDNVGQIEAINKHQYISNIINELGVAVENNKDYSASSTNSFNKNVAELRTVIDEDESLTNEEKQDLNNQLNSVVVKYHQKKAEATQTEYDGPVEAISKYQHYLGIINRLSGLVDQNQNYSEESRSSFYENSELIKKQIQEDKSITNEEKEDLIKKIVEVEGKFALNNITDMFNDLGDSDALKVVDKTYLSFDGEETSRESGSYWGESLFANYNASESSVSFVIGNDKRTVYAQEGEGGVFYSDEKSDDDMASNKDEFITNNISSISGIVQSGSIHYVSSVDDYLLEYADESGMKYHFIVDMDGDSLKSIHAKVNDKEGFSQESITEYREISEEEFEKGVKNIGSEVERIKELAGEKTK